MTRARYPRRKRGLVPVRWYHGTFRLDGRVLAIPVARGCPPLVIRLDRDIPYPAGQVRSVTLGYDGGRLYADVTAEVPVAVYPPGQGPDPGRTAGSTWASSIGMPPRDRRGRGCWCPGGRSGRSAGSTCATARAVPGLRPACPRCGQAGHRDLVAAASIAARGPGSGIIPAVPAGPGITHRRAGSHLPGVHPARRDPRRRPPSRPAPRRHLAGTGPPPTTPDNGTRGVARGNARSPQTARDNPRPTYGQAH